MIPFPALRAIGYRSSMLGSPSSPDIPDTVSGFVHKNRIYREFFSVMRAG